MDFLYVVFPVSGVKTYIYFPFVISFVISFFTSMSGVSGAFLILPFQMSFLGFVTPSVTSTNFVYNIVGIPGGVYRYFQEKRILWPLVWITTAGTLPGLLGGYYIRVNYMIDPRLFKFFVGVVLLYIGIRLVMSIFAHKKVLQNPEKKDQLELGRNEDSFIIQDVSFNLQTVEYTFCDERIVFSTKWMFLLACVVGIIGGIYGIGGGAIIAPFCVAVFKLPVYTISGAALLGTFITSIIGVIFYSFISLAGKNYPPDWSLGILLGMGGLLGMYLGARMQKYVPENFIKSILCLILISIAFLYIQQLFS